MSVEMVEINFFRTGVNGFGRMHKVRRIFRVKTRILIGCVMRKQNWLELKNLNLTLIINKLDKIR